MFVDRRSELPSMAPHHSVLLTPTRLSPHGASIEPVGWAKMRWPHESAGFTELKQLAISVDFHAQQPERSEPEYREYAAPLREASRMVFHGNARTQQRPRGAMSIGFLVGGNQKHASVPAPVVPRAPLAPVAYAADSRYERVQARRQVHRARPYEHVAPPPKAAPTHEPAAEFSLVGQLCAKRNCYRQACSLYGEFCEFHKPSRLCKVPECRKCAKTGGFCIAHGGGRRCQVAACTKSAKEGGLCISHGGGKRCQTEGCDRAVVTAGACSAHSESKRSRT